MGIRQRKDEVTVMLKEQKDIWIAQRADPYVCRSESGPNEGTYYFTATVPEYDRIIMRSSGQLEALAEAEEVTVWTKHDKGVMGNHIWAPELPRISGGRGRMCWSAGEQTLWPAPGRKRV